MVVSTVLMEKLKQEAAQNVVAETPEKLVEETVPHSSLFLPSNKTQSLDLSSSRQSVAHLAVKAPNIAITTAIPQVNKEEIEEYFSTPKSLKIKEMFQNPKNEVSEE